MRQYERIWLTLKELPVKEELPVRIHADARKRLIQAVKLEKTKEVAIKKRLDIPRAGLLKIRWTEDTVRKDPQFVIVYFSLLWDGSKL